MPADPFPGPVRDPDPLMIFPASDSPVISAQDAATALRELFLTNADQGNHAANDDLVAELVHRIRTQQQSRSPKGSQPLPGQ